MTKRFHSGFLKGLVIEDSLTFISAKRAASYISALTKNSSVGRKSSLPYSVASYRTEIVS
jgi:hypothetical protein